MSSADKERQPLTEEELRVLQEMERRLHEEDPRLARAAASSLYAFIARRIRWGVVAFVVGLLMLMAFAVSVWVALAGFGVMLAAGLFIYAQLRRLGLDQVGGPADQDRFPLTASLARLAERLRGRRQGPA
ncbi:MAG TPA: DUF3040 domain-containing protein [Actinomycetota bacterium]|jgi:hypothetical protein